MNLASASRDASETSLKTLPPKHPNQPTKIASQPLLSKSQSRPIYLPSTLNSIARYTRGQQYIPSEPHLKKPLAKQNGGQVLETPLIILLNPPTLPRSRTFPFGNFTSSLNSPKTISSEQRMSFTVPFAHVLGRRS